MGKHTAGMNGRQKTQASDADKASVRPDKAQEWGEGVGVNTSVAGG